MESSESDEWTPILKNYEPGIKDTQERKGKFSDLEIDIKETIFDSIIALFVEQ